MGESLLCVLFGQFIFLALISLITPVNTSSSTLQLFPGLHLNILSSYNRTTGFPLSLGRMFTVATPTLDEGGLFFPILSSPLFINNVLPLSSSSSISTPTSKFGYSLGFYIKPFELDISAGRYPECSGSGCYFYLAVCAGFLGSVNESLNGGMILPLTATSRTNLSDINPMQNVDGFAAPVWIANLESPIRYVDKASLMVQRVDTDHDGGGLELQLRDGENVVWRVRSNASCVMEVQDTGHFNLLQNSTNGSAHVEWSTPARSDTLVFGGKGLAVGEELVSNGSSYVARMEKGGLVFYMNKTRFNRQAQQPLTPYWAFPVPSQDAAGSNRSLNQLIASAPCSNSPAHLDPFEEPHNHSPEGLSLDPGMCSPNLSVISDQSLTPSGSLTFWRLEADGMLYRYSVFSEKSGSAASVTRYSQLWYGSEFDSIIPLVLRWQQCSLPMACGPLGLCTPGAQCSCSEYSDFKPVDSTNPLQGCRRSINLPNCNSNGKGHTSLTDFVELNSTASILLFNEWTFNSTPGMEVDACKQSCSLDCSCNGFFYQMRSSSCFFISDEISLMRVVDTNYTPMLSFLAREFDNPTIAPNSIQHQIFAKDYVTFLKVASTADLPLADLPKGKSSIRSAFIAVGVSLLVCLLLGVVAYLLVKAGLRKTHDHYTSRMLSAEESKELQDLLPLLPNRFSYKELSEATRCFTRLLGAGGCGSVYAGLLLDGRKVAVKVLQATRLQGSHQSKQFLAEIATIGRIHHHNIVRLIGFCWEVSQRLLVYEYVERGSLDRWIFVKEPVALVDGTSIATPLLLDWKTRYNVALGIARGLTYLHEDCEQPILHFDIKPQNILLDNEFVAKLADFGMARLMERDMSAVVTGMRGTPGYIAPEWCTQATVSKRSDIYSMGMVFLEIVGGRKNLDFSLLNSSLKPEEQEAWHFPSWAARKCEEGRAMELVDSRLQQEGGGFDATQALRLIHIAFWCIQENPGMRPYAPTVVQWLEGNSSSCDVEQPPFSTTMRIGSDPAQQLNKEEHLFFSKSTSCLISSLIVSTIS